VRSKEKVNLNNLPIKVTLPENFLDEEIRCDYKISSKMKAVWAVEIDLYLELERVCKKYDLCIYGDGGTVLGAVRHGGFIPWDDDMDFCMPRKDYTKLCSVAKKEFRYPYFWQTEDTDPGTARGHGQLRNSMTTALNYGECIFETNHGIFIDVFPFDIVPEDTRERHLYLKKLYHLYNKKNIYREGFYKVNTSKGIRMIIKNINIFILSLFSSNYINRYYYKWDNFKLKYEEMTSKYWANLYYVDINRMDRMVLPIEYYRTGTMLSFEFIKIRVPLEYKNYLKHAYGKWEEYIIGASVHDDIIFDPYKPFSEYTESGTRE